MDRDRSGPPTPPAPLSEEAVWEHVLAMRENAAAVAGTDLSFLSDEGIDGLLHASEEAARVLTVVQRRLAGQVADRDLAAARGYASTVAYLRDVLRVRCGEAASRVRQAGFLDPRTTVTGEVLDPLYPRLAKAQGDGAISLTHVQVVIDRLEHLPAAVTQQDRDQAERILTEHAAVYDPATLGKLATKVASVLDPDGTLTSEEERKVRRELRFGTDLHGMTTVNGRLDPESAGWLHAALDSLAAPTPAADGAKDPRTPGQRNADALVELARMGCTHPDMPSHGGAKPTLVVTIGLAELQQASGLGRLPYGDAVTARAALRLGCDATVIPAILDHTGEPLSLGRSQRVISPAQRRALELRDKGCVMTGCDAPASRCEGHHMTPWALGGRTDLDNLALGCTIHHRWFDTGDWTLELKDGRVWVTPPPWIDPSQMPRVNHLHDP